jgi:hypothetical protein
MSNHPGERRSHSKAHEAALAVAKTAPTKHVPRHVTITQVREQLHGTSAIGRFNNAVAVKVTQAIGSMWAAYLFVLIALVSLPQALMSFLNGDTVTGIAWLSQSFLQLVLLPILMVGQRVIAAGQDARAETDHETLTALHQINVQQLAILEVLEGIRQPPASR